MLVGAIKPLNSTPRNTTYKVIHADDDKTYIVPDDNNPTDIWCDYKTDNRGCNGRRIGFDTGKAIPHIAEGPYQIDATSLYRDTGIDLRYEFEAILVVTRNPYKAEEPFDPCDILHEDVEPIKGAYRRDVQLGREYADKTGGRVWVHRFEPDGSWASTLVQEPQERRIYMHEDIIMTAVNNQVRQNTEPLTFMEVTNDGALGTNKDAEEAVRNLVREGKIVVKAGQIIPRD